MVTTGARSHFSGRNIRGKNPRNSISFRNPSATSGATAGASAGGSGGRTVRVVVEGKETIVNITEGSRLTGGGVTSSLVSIVKQQEAQKAAAVEAERLQQEQQEAFNDIRSRQMQASLESPTSFSQDLKPVYPFGEQSRGFTQPDQTSKISPPVVSAANLKPVFEFGEQSRGFVAITPTPKSPKTSETLNVSTGFEPSGIAGEEVYTTFIRDPVTGKTKIFNEPKRLAIEPEGFDTVRGRLDFALGGFLPGGISREQALDLKEKEKLGADFAPLKEDATFFTSFVKKGKTPAEQKARDITKRDVAKLFGTSAIVTTGAIVAGVPSLIGSLITKAGVGIAALTNPVLAVKAASGLLLTAGAAGTVIETTKIIGGSQETKFQKEFVAGGDDHIKAVNDAIKAKREAVAEKRKEYSITGSDVLKKISLFSKVKVETGRIAARESLRESGLGLEGGKLEEITSLVLQRDTTLRLAEVGALVTISVGSELIGRFGANKFIPKTIPAKGTPAFKNVVNKVTQQIGVAGFAEGAATDIALTHTGNLEIDPIRTATVGILGAGSAAGLGGLIVQKDLAGKTLTSNTLLGGAYISDPFELPGDKLADVAEKLSGISARGIKTKVITAAASVSSFISDITKGKTDTGFGVSVISESGKATPIKTRIVSEIPAGTKQATFSIDFGGVPTSTNIFSKKGSTKTFDIVKSGGRRGGISEVISGGSVTPTSNVLQNFLSTPPSNTPADIFSETPSNIITDTPVSIDTSTNINNNIYNIISTSTSTSVFTPVSTSTSTSTTTTTPVPVPTFNIPLFIPPRGVGGFKFKPFKGLTRQTKFQTSLAASEQVFVKAFGKTAATKKSPFITGVELRL